jgi:hypothetical protein
MLDYGASHNVIPKDIMDKLGPKSLGLMEIYFHLIQEKSNAYA